MLQFSPAGQAAETSLASALYDTILRRDIILGGDDNDVLCGGSWEEWIFGGPGNDVLSGGYDRQAGDLLWGGPGDDTFQLLPDDLPLIKTTQRYIDPADQQTYLPTFSDRFDGQEGNDQVLFLGGDFDSLGRPVPDHVAVRYNTILHRFELTGRVWNAADQGFVTDRDGAFVQQYAYFQAFGMEGFALDTRAGNDEVRADSEYLIAGSEWGIDPEDRPKLGSQWISRPPGRRLLRSSSTVGWIAAVKK